MRKSYKSKKGKIEGFGGGRGKERRKKCMEEGTESMANKLEED